MSKTIKKIIDYIFVKIFVLLGNHLCMVLFERFINGLQNYTNTYITYHQRPQRASSILSTSQLEQSLPKLAIIIQGPIITKNDFTFETTKLYKQLFPNAIIILSTWNQEKQSLVSCFDKLGVNILLNKKPDYAGVSNINLQIISTKSGINKAKELGVEYAIKTRTDQRINAPNIESFLFNIINVFPLNPSIVKQKKRIVGLSLNTFKYRMYGLSDMFTYGHIDDMLLYWGIPLDTRIFGVKEIETANKTLRNFAKWRICEVFLTTEFLKNVDFKLEWTLEDSWKAFSNHFCVVDKQSFDLYWGKYGFLEDRWKKYDKNINVFEELNFKEWLNLYNHQKDCIVPEEFLDHELNN
jgi:hypothetical protein